MRTRKRAPAHPGRIIKNHHLEPLTMKIKDLANVLGVSRKTLSKIVNEHGSITPDMALRLSRAFDTSPDLWLKLLFKRILIYGRPQINQMIGKRLSR
jgi:addiction module HigA family antidote